MAVLLVNADMNGNQISRAVSVGLAVWPDVLNLRKRIFFSSAQPDIISVRDLRFLNEKIRLFADGGVQLEKEGVVNELGDWIIVLGELKELINVSEVKSLVIEVFIDLSLWSASNVLINVGLAFNGVGIHICRCGVLALPELNLQRLQPLAVKVLAK